MDTGELSNGIRLRIVIFVHNLLDVYHSAVEGFGTMVEIETMGSLPLQLDICSDESYPTMTFSYGIFINDRISSTKYKSNPTQQIWGHTSILSVMFSYFRASFYVFGIVGHRCGTVMLMSLLQLVLLLHRCNATHSIGNRGICNNSCVLKQRRFWGFSTQVFLASFSSDRIHQFLFLFHHNIPRSTKNKNCIYL